MEQLRLGVNIDHVATLRNARGGTHPCPVRAAMMAIDAGADVITAHLREDRRHIRNTDMERLARELTVPLNFEMAATHEMQQLALKLKPHACCLVPEKREERTTEGGLDVVGNEAMLREYIAPLNAVGIRVSMFIDPVEAQIRASHNIGAGAVELHTGAYAELHGAARAKELEAIATMAALTHSLGMECHAGHGLNYENVSDIAAISQIIELNIGHFLMGEAVFLGLPRAIKTMRELMDNARKKVAA